MAAGSDICSVTSQLKSKGVKNIGALTVKEGTASITTNDDASAHALLQIKVHT